MIDRSIFENEIPLLLEKVNKRAWKFGLLEKGVEAFKYTDNFNAYFSDGSYVFVNTFKTPAISTWEFPEYNRVLGYQYTKNLFVRDNGFGLVISAKKDTRETSYWGQWVPSKEPTWRDLMYI